LEKIFKKKFQKKISKKKFQKKISKKKFQKNFFKKNFFEMYSTYLTIGDNYLGLANLFNNSIGDILNVSTDKIDYNTRFNMYYIIVCKSIRQKILFLII
jgi:hypothetical protein